MIEAWNRVNTVIFYSKSGEFASNRRDQQQLGMLALHILQAALVYVNTPPPPTDNGSPPAPAGPAPRLYRGTSGTAAAAFRSTPGPQIADEELRGRIGRQLNKGEQLHALRRAIFYANEGQVRQRTPDQQSEQALCLSIVVNAIIAWNTVYTARVLDELRAAGELITTSEIEHISPLAHQHIHLYGHYPFDLATRPDGHRLLRAPPTPPSPAPKTLNRV